MYNYNVFIRDLIKNTNNRIVVEIQLKVYEGVYLYNSWINLFYNYDICDLKYILSCDKRITLSNKTIEESKRQ